jgi:HlyD family secretion protein
MSGIWSRRLLGLLLVGLAAAAAVWFAWPRPIPVEIARIGKGYMEVTVEEEGRTRVRNVYTVSAPIAGRALRTPRRIGDEVIVEETVVAVIEPADPGLLDIHSREELEAALSAAEAAVGLAEHEVQRLEAALEFARAELDRAEALARRAVVPVTALDKARVDVDVNAHALASARAHLDVRRSERAGIAARLAAPTPGTEAAGAGWAVQLRAPVTGNVLRIFQESEAVVPAGAPLIEIGDPLDLEVVSDLLSTEAVQLEIGAPVRIDGWGGLPIRGELSRIDRAGFTKVSALGIDEQRVRATVDLVDPPEAWGRLGHDFRVIVHVTQWSAEDVLTVPVAALFRLRDTWAVFRVEEGRARVALVQIGRRNNEVAEVVEGLSTGDAVILHPSDRIVDGVAVAERATADSATAALRPAD